MVLRFITREEWGAEPPKKRRPINVPVSNVGEDHWVPRTINKKHLHSTCNSEEECKERMRLVQKMAFDESQSDLNYSFIIGGDGNIYEGRGWATLIPEDSLWDGIVIGYIGKFSVEEPVPEFMSEKFQELVEFGKKRGYITKDPILFKLNRTNEDPELI